MAFVKVAMEALSTPLFAILLIAPGTAPLQFAAVIQALLAGALFHVPLAAYALGAAMTASNAAARSVACLSVCVTLVFMT